LEPRQARQPGDPGLWDISDLKITELNVERA
jgi:hypothetical protein